MNYTPTPWFIEEDKLTWNLYGGNGMIPLKIIKAPKKSKEYAEYWPFKGDANLICAAPDMYEILKRCKQFLNEMTCTDEELEWMVNEVIKKVEGNDVIVMDKYLTRLESLPEDTRPKINKITNEIKYLYSISNNKQIVPRIKCCPICGELDNNEDQEHILVRYESWHVDFYCDKCGFNGSVDYLKPDEWNPEVEGKEIVF